MIELHLCNQPIWAFVSDLALHFQFMEALRQVDETLNVSVLICRMGQIVPNADSCSMDKVAYVKHSTILLQLRLF